VDQSPTHRRLGDRGVSSIQFLLAAALSLTVFLALANLVVVQYGRGAMRSALDQGARAGAIAHSEQVCETVARDVLSQLLGGRMGDSVSLHCGVVDGLMAASATAMFESWTPVTGDFEVAVSGEAALEHPR
jgi:hypothetical protein